MGLITPSSGRAGSTLSTGSTGRNAKENRWSKFAGAGFQKSVKVSDWAGGYANSLGNKFAGGERFWPTSGDFAQELEKCTRIIKGFTQEGFVRQEQQDVAPQSDDPNANEVEETAVVGLNGQPLTKEQAESLPASETRVQKIKKKVKKVNIIRKIPPQVLQQACGIAIYSAMRTGIAPLGGSGGGGVALARLPDGSWSAPSFITPQNFAVGLMLGFDLYDVVLLIMRPDAMEGFMSHKFTVGAEGGVAAGPVGTGGSVDVSLNGTDWKSRNISPIFSYVRSRGAYAGVEAMAQALLTRFDENERVYHWPGVTGRDVLTGKVRKIHEADALYQALAAAETGSAQQTPSGLHLPPDLEKELGGAIEPGAEQREFVQAGDNRAEKPPLELESDERIHLPPTPEQLATMERSGVKDEEDARMEAKYKTYIWSLPAPPRHPEAKKIQSGISRGKPGGRFVAPAPGSPSAGGHVSRSSTSKSSGSHTSGRGPPAYSPSGLVPPPQEKGEIHGDENPPPLPGAHPTAPYAATTDASISHADRYPSAPQGTSSSNAPTLPENHPTSPYQPMIAKPGSDESEPLSEATDHDQHPLVGAVDEDKTHDGVVLPIAEGAVVQEPSKAQHALNEPKTESTGHHGADVAVSEAQRTPTPVKAADESNIEHVPTVTGSPAAPAASKEASVAAALPSLSVPSSSFQNQRSSTMHSDTDSEDQFAEAEEQLPNEASSTDQPIQIHNTSSLPLPDDAAPVDEKATRRNDPLQFAPQHARPVSVNANTTGSPSQIGTPSDPGSPTTSSSTVSGPPARPQRAPSRGMSGLARPPRSDARPTSAASQAGRGA